MQAHESLCLREGGLGTVLSLVKVEDSSFWVPLPRIQGEAAGLPKMRGVLRGQGLGLQEPAFLMP